MDCNNISQLFVLVDSAALKDVRCFAKSMNKAGVIRLRQSKLDFCLLQCRDRTRVLSYHHRVRDCVPLRTAASSASPVA